MSDKDKAKDSSSSDEGASSSLASKLEVAIEEVQNFIKDKLKLDSDADLPKKIKEPTVAALVDYIQSGQCKRIITLVGAGISTSAGIPDFRSPGSGLYDNLQKYDLPHPEAIFTLDYFHYDAQPFFSLAKEFLPGKFKPTKSHYFIKMLQDKGLLVRHYTQNIDTLERIAGITEENLVEAHGTFNTGHCLGCRKEYTQDWMKQRIIKDEIPICTDCPGVVKPDIVFFGENLPKKFYRCLGDFKKCDLLIIMGSTLTVQPFAQLVDKVAKNVPRVLINKEKAGTLSFGKGNTRNIALLGDCDEQCQLLADKLGWGKELQNMVIIEHAKIDAKEQQDASSSL